MKIYLCSRVAYDARPFNDQVAKALRDAGHDVYVPHEQAPNNLTQDDINAGRYDKATIFEIDYNALSKSDLVVAVGRLGKDCAWELGYAYGVGIPVVHVPGDDVTWETSPMMLPGLNEFTKATVDTVADTVEQADRLRFQLFVAQSGGAL